MDDNPLVDIASGRMLSNGNFHPMVLALALDALRPAAAHVGQLTDRRMNHLWASVAERVLRRGRHGAPRRRGRRPVALRRCRARVRAPARREPRVARRRLLDLGVEDHATNAPVAAALTARALDLLEEILTIELEMARIAHALRPAAASAPAVAAAFASLGEARATVGPRPSSGTGPRGGVRGPVPRGARRREGRDPGRLTGGACYHRPAMSDRPRFYLTTAIAYANNAPGPPHGVRGDRRRRHRALAPDAGRRHAVPDRHRRAQRQHRPGRRGAGPDAARRSSTRRSSCSTRPRTRC